MSSRRYQEDIRRIVGMPDVVGGLDDEVPRMRIDGARGIFMIGAGETKSGSSGGTDDDGNTTDPVMPDENEDNMNEDGSGTGGSGTDPDGTGAGTGDGDGDSGVDVIDPEDTGNFSPDDTTFGDGWGSGGVSTFADCVDDTCIEIVERGGYVPPEGFDDVENFLPNIDDYDYPVDGFVWSAGDFTGGSPSDVAAYFSLAPLNNPLFTSKSYRSNDVTWRWEFYTWVVPTTGTTGSGTFQAGRGIDPNAIYPPPTPMDWPSDDCIQLAPNADGQWAASPYESPDDITAKYSEPKSILDLCTPNGDGVQILPGADGGSVRWNYTQGFFMSTSPSGKRSFGGATEITTAVAGSVAAGTDDQGDRYIKAVGAPVPSS